MSYTYEELKGVYTQLINQMQIRPSWMDRANAMARRIIAGKARYEAVSAGLVKKGFNRIPWQFIGIIHALESDLNWNTHLHNGDSLGSRTHHVPAGRPIAAPRNGQRYTWEESAEDALMQKGYHLVTEWPVSFMAYAWEKYNGFGYRAHGTPSAYLWSGSNNYTSGKYVADGVWDAHHVSEQIGTMVLLARVRALDVTSDVVAEGSRKISILRRVKEWFVATFGGYFTADALGVIPDKIKQFEAFGLSKTALALIGLGVTFWFVTSLIEYLHQQDYSNGNYTPSKFVENDINHQEDVLL